MGESVRAQGNSTLKANVTERLADNGRTFD